MALIDELRKAAQQRPTFDPSLPTTGSGLAGRRELPTIQRSRVDQNRLLEMLGSPRTPVRAPAGGGVLPGGMSFSEYRSARNQGLNVNDDGTLEAPGPSLASKFFSGLIDVVDTPRAAVVATVKEGLDVLPGMRGGDGSFDAGDIVQNTRDNIRFGDVLREHEAFAADNKYLKWVQPTVGFVGDVAADPLTYAGIGLVKRGAGGAASALDNAFLSGSRRGLAEEVASQAAKRGIATDVVDDLIREAGKRGRGAFTAKGLARSGTSRETLEQLGLTARFGVGVGHMGTRGAKAYIPGSRAVAEGVENLRGSLKQVFGSSAGAKVFRRLFVGGDSAIGQAERKFVNEVITGAENAGDAARGLGVIRAARADAHKWLSDEAEKLGLEDFDKALSKLSKDDAVEIARKIEMGELGGDELAMKISQWYDDIETQLRDLGVEFGRLDNYVNHMLTPRARREVMRGTNGRLHALGLDATEAFQKTRTLKAGDEFLGETLQAGTIDEINQISQRVLGYKLYEDDVRELMSAYLTQAMEARMRRQIYNLADGFDMNVSGAAYLQESLAEIQRQGADLLQKATRTRRKALTQAAKDASKAHKQIAAQAADVETRLNAAMRNVADLEDQVARSAKQVADTEQALARWQRILEGAKNSRKPEVVQMKSKATRQITKLTKELEQLQQFHSETLAKMGRARSSKSIHKLGRELEGLRQQLADAAATFDTADAARRAMDDPDWVIPGTEMTDAQVQKTMDRVAKAREDFVASKKAHFDASAAFVWQLADDNTQAIRLGNKLDDLEQIIASKKGAGQLGADELQARLNTVVESFDKLNMSDAARAVRTAEAQALAHDVGAGLVEVPLQESKRALLDALGNERFQNHMVRVLEDGFHRIDQEIAVPEWFDEAFKSIPRTQKEWGAVRSFVQGIYDSFLNLWKGYAVTSPGFVFRNAYSGMFNMYLDGVRPDNVKAMWGFLRRYNKNGVEAAREWALKSGKYTQEEVSLMEQALEAAAASGWGLNPQEVSQRLVGSGWSKNPFNTEFAPIKGIREASSQVEAIMRSGHAYDVLKRGGSLDEAIRHVEKFHFNYRDISEFDRMAKRVIPFWTFYSRNMALQAQVWYRFPDKLNRTYFNLKANLEATSDPEQVVPSYYDELGAIRLPFSGKLAGLMGEEAGGNWYLTPDIPSLRFRDDLAKITGLGPDGFQPTRMLADTAPWIKVPAEGLAGQEFFTGIDYKNRLYDYDADGNPVPRRATDLLQGEIPGTDYRVPVVGDLIRHAADIGLGNKAQIVNGELLITDRGESIVDDMQPGISRLNRLFPNNEKYIERRGQSVLSFMGAPLRQNTTQAQRGEMYARQKAAEDQARQQAIMEMLQGMTG